MPLIGCRFPIRGSGIEVVCEAISNLGHWQFVVALIGLAYLLASEGIRNDNGLVHAGMFAACVLLLVFWIVQC